MILNGALIKILPDLSRATLQRRACLHPVQDLAKDQGCTYRWGYPVVVKFRRESSSFTIHTPADLPRLFTFLDVAPIQITNWLSLIPYKGGVVWAPRIGKDSRAIPKYANSPEGEFKTPQEIGNGLNV